MFTMIQSPTVTDYAVIKSKQNAAWGSGDYAKIGSTLQIVGETLAEAMDLSPNSKVLDVAAGNGNATLALARRWCDVTSTDYVGTLLSRGRARADSELLDVTYQIADAENLPFERGSFDAVVSTFGVMFAPNQLKAASEMLRVCRFGGSIGMANWTPEGFIGQVFATLGKHVAPAAGPQVPGHVGQGGLDRRSLCGRRLFDRVRASRLYLPVSVAGAFRGLFSYLLRPGPQGIPCA